MSGGSLSEGFQDRGLINGDVFAKGKHIRVMECGIQVLN